MTRRALWALVVLTLTGVALPGAMPGHAQSQKALHLVLTPSQKPTDLLAAGEPQEPEMGRRAVSRARASGGDERDRPAVGRELWRRLAALTEADVEPVVDLLEFAAALVAQQLPGLAAALSARLAPWRSRAGSSTSSVHGSASRAPRSCASFPATSST